MSTLAKPLVDAKPGEKRALLAERLRKVAGYATRPPLSFAQQRLWFLDQLLPDHPLYSVPMVARLSGKLDAGALEKALIAIAERHETLRTRIVSTDGEPAQVIDPTPEIKLRRVSIGELPQGRREDERKRVI